MSTLYKVKLTRISTADIWPLNYFSDEYVTEFEADPTGYQNPISIPSFGFAVWPRTAGFISYSYEEYDPSTDSIASEHIANGTDTVDVVGADSKMVWNPSSLTLTSLVTFDTLANLTAFVNTCNNYWVEPITKSVVKSYIESKGMTIEEEIYVDGVLNTDTGLSCFNFD